MPPGFVFAVKASRLITHMTKLADGRPYLTNSLANARLLGRKLGPVLFQLPGNWRANVLRLAAFVERLPRGRFAFEFRHPSWIVPEVLEILRRRRIGYCCFDMGGEAWPVHVTADFAYMRFHGPSPAKYTGGYTRRALCRWARVLHDVARDVDRLYVYFNNDRGGHAVTNAVTLRSLLG